jgi:hypothetical protein
MKNNPRVDPVCKELVKNIENDKIPAELKIEAAESLSHIIRLYGKSITAPVNAQIH